MSARGKLAVSVIGSPPRFYVRISIGDEELQTVPASGLTPKFMKDLEFTVEDIEKAVATVEMFHVAPKGDLVLGTCRVPLRNPAGYEGRPSWLELRDAGGRTVGKLCVVMRFAAVGTPGRSAATPRTPKASRTAPDSAVSAGTAATTAKSRGSRKNKAAKGPGPLGQALGGVAGIVKGALHLLLGVGGGKKKKQSSRGAEEASGGRSGAAGRGGRGKGGAGVPVPIAGELAAFCGATGFLDVASGVAPSGASRGTTSGVKEDSIGTKNHSPSREASLDALPLPCGLGMTHGGGRCSQLGWASRQGSWGGFGHRGPFTTRSRRGIRCATLLGATMSTSLTYTRATTKNWQAPTSSIPVTDCVSGDVSTGCISGHHRQMLSAPMREACVMPGVLRSTLHWSLL